jgi:hypothetical protein
MIGSTYDFNPFRLFPEDVLRDLKIHHIKFNAIPKTVMAKTVQKWLEKLKVPKTTKLVEGIIEKANGNLFRLNLYF